MPFVLALKSVFIESNSAQSGVNFLRDLTMQHVKVSELYKYCKTCVKRPLKNRQNKDLNNK